MKYQGFQLDDFQNETVNAVNNGESIVVAAPTGCGKTLLAEYAVDVSLEMNKCVIYTAPIKALSNQKYRDFKKRFGEKIVGIHTGDVTINPEAQLLIMTTEIFRNIILENPSRFNNVHYAIFDEIHYLDDPDRGTVWEESIILAPGNIRFMCLSATIPNLQEISSWMSYVRNTPFRVINETHRPVPLRHNMFSSKYGLITLKGIKKKFKIKHSERKKFLRKRQSSKKIVSHVIKNGHFPIIYFCFNRRSCERNAERHSHLELLTHKEKDKITGLIEDLISLYNLQEYESVNKMQRLWKNGIAYHHAGLLPASKEIVERLFTTGLIKLVFCTETFALGINMPASAVIFDEIEKFDGTGFSYLKTRDYNQMAGRAGRRGMDEEGHVYSQIVPEATDPKEVQRILHGKNEKITSRFIPSYSTILNLYSRLGNDAFSLFRKSLSNFNSGSFSLSNSYRKQEEQIRCRIKFLQSAGFLDKTNLTEKGKLASSISGYEIQSAQLYYSREFDTLSPQQLCVIICALITEEKRNRKITFMQNINFSSHIKRTISRLRKLEIKHGIDQPIPEMDFSFAGPVYQWANGCQLKELFASGVPEGDMIRLLRMTIQLLRAMRDAIDDPVITNKMHEAYVSINRDIVDAQTEFELT